MSDVMTHPGEARLELPAAGMLALVADIHANLPALEAVAADIAAAAPDLTLCLGDVAATGPHPHEVVETLRRLEWPTLLGNADAWLLEPDTAEGAGLDEFQRQVRDLDLWDRARLDEVDRGFLASLPRILRLRLGDARELLCFHGSPRSYDEVLLATTPDEALAEAIADSEAPLLAGGHTHQPLLRRYRDRLLINPGSVGLPYERTADGALSHTPARAEFALLRWSRDAVHVSFRQVPLDNRAIVAAYRASGMPHADTFTRGRS